MSPAALPVEPGRAVALFRQPDRPVELSPSVMLYSGVSTVGSEAIRALRTHVQSQHLQEGRRGLAICSPSQGSGCTFVAVNLAVALASIGIATLLIDANMRDPGVDKMIRTPASNLGLRDVLAGGYTAADVIDENVLPNLSVLYSGGSAPDAHELLAGERFSQVINGCLRDYDATIIDTPPANICADARRVSNVVGYSLVVARKNRTLVADLKTLVGELEGDRATVIGSVLNEL